jgi:hypothetical protein
MIAALVIAGFAVPEGMKAWRGQSCCPPPAALLTSDDGTASGGSEVETEDSSEGGGFQDGHVEVMTVAGIKAAHAAAQGDDPSRQMAYAVKTASPPNPRRRCGARRAHRSAAGDGGCDCRWDEGAHEIIDLVAGKWRAARTGNGDEVIAVFDSHDHSPIGMSGSRIKNYGVRQRTGRQPIYVARVGRGDLLPFDWDTDAPDFVQPYTKP